MSVVSDTRTAPNLPGTGRTLDIVITSAGVKLEQRLNSFALKIGLGPEAVERSLDTQLLPFWYWNKTELSKEAYRSRIFSESLRENGKFMIACKKLVKYAKYALCPVLPFVETSNLIIMQIGCLRKPSRRFARN